MVKNNTVWRYTGNRYNLHTGIIKKQKDKLNNKRVFKAKIANKNSKTGIKHNNTCYTVFCSNK